MNSFKKIIILILIQVFLIVNSAWAGGFELSANPQTATLSPQIAIDINSFQASYNEYSRIRQLGADIVLPAGCIRDSDILEHGVIISDKTTNFKIGNSSFRIPPYLAGRVARLHVTAINQNNFEFQKMGIGVGQRKKTIAVVLVDLNDQNNQLLVLAQEDRAWLKALNKTEPEETIALGNNARFDSMARQDSFLERSRLGNNFIEQVLGIDQTKQNKVREWVNALTILAGENPKLKTDLPVNLAFFSQNYMLNFSLNLKKHSHIAVLKDREQRGRFIAIVDKLNPDNYVVFERRGDKVFVLGENEQELIPKLEKHEKAQVIYFTDFDQGARFCRNVTRDLIKLNFSKNSNSLTLGKNVQLHVGAHNPGITVLKANQVTQPTPTGYQVKQRALEFSEQSLATYPLYVLPADFDQDISVTEAAIDFDSADYIFFSPQELAEWPRYISYGSAENSVYYQHLPGAYEHEEQLYTVYRAINKQDILGALLFNNDASFTISGINWKDGKPVVFRNVKNIALNNIVSQLSQSEFIKIAPELNEYFNVSGLDAGTNPLRSTYKFKAGFFEQAENIKMDREIDYADVQKEQDEIIEKNKFEIETRTSRVPLSLNKPSSVENSKEFLPEVKLEKLSQDQAFIMAEMLDTVLTGKKISLLNNAMDLDPDYAYSVDVNDKIKIVFISQDPDAVSNVFEVLKPDTYYVAIIYEKQLIGYGYIDFGIMPKDEDILVTFRLFEEYRHQGEKLSARIFKTMLSGAREIFGDKVTGFALANNQINNQWGLESAAVVFYLKMGFKLEDERLQNLWKNKYEPQIQQGLTLDGAVISELSQGNIYLNLNSPNASYNVVFSGAPLYPEKEIVQFFIEQAI
ncbi:MAG: hypothetical protein KKD05_02245 [Candidatus Omnitrophica bacterium]|nr:hypothetical protein [Candidatus Omnitrophota bacterium]